MPADLLVSAAEIYSGYLTRFIPAGLLSAMRIWLSKPIYEFIPYFYLLSGAACLMASLYLDYWYWPKICLAGGIFCLILGLVILLKRRDYREVRRQPD